MIAYRPVKPDSLHPDQFINPASVNPRIRSVIIHVLGRYGALRILGIGRGVQSLCQELHHKGYSVATIEPEESTGLPQIDSAANLGSIGAAPFHMAVSIEGGEPSVMPSALIQLAASRLEYGGVFTLSVPYGGHLNNLLITMRGCLNSPRFTPWEGGYIQRWSTRGLNNLLESQGFTVVEIIGVRGPSLQWEALIVVARKIGLQPPGSGSIPA